MRAAFASSVWALILFSHPSAGSPPEPRETLVLQVPPAASVNSVAVSRDGSLVATAAGEGGVRLYNAQTGSLLRTIGAGADRAVVFAPDGKTFTAAGFHMDKLVSLWDVESGKRLRTFAGQTEWEADATAISPDGKLLASSATDMQILVWDIATGQLRLQLKDQPSRVTALAFSPDSATLTAGSDKQIRLWNCSTGELLRSLTGHSEWVCTLAFSANGQTIASGACDWGFHRGHDWPRPANRGVERCEWRIWDVSSGEVRRAERESGRLLSLALDHTGRLLVCGMNSEVRVYDLDAATPAKIVTRHDADVTSVAFTPDGAAIISGSHDQTVKCTRLHDVAMEWQAPGFLEQVNTVALSDDASLLVTGSSDHRFARGRLQAGARHIGPGAVRVWDAQTGRLLRRLGNPADQVMGVAISPDGRRIASGSGLSNGGGATRVWDTRTWELLWSSEDHAKEVLAVAFSPEGISLATAAAEGVLTLRDAATGQVRHRWEGLKGGATSLAFSTDGGILFGGEGFGGTVAWDTATGKRLQTFKAAGSQAEFFTNDRLMHSISVSHDGRVLATCASSVNNEFVNPVRLWDARSGTLLRDFTAEKIQGRPMALSPDGSIIATGGKSITLWDVQTGRLLRELFGNLKRTQSIVFSRDGRMIWSGGSYGTANAWEVATGRHLVTLFVFPGAQDDAEEEEWLAYDPSGFYDGSLDVERYLAWRVGDELLTPQTIGGSRRRPQRIDPARDLVARPTAAPIAKRSHPAAIVAHGGRKRPG